MIVPVNCTSRSSLIVVKLTSEHGNYGDVARGWGRVSWSRGTLPWLFSGAEADHNGRASCIGIRLMPHVRGEPTRPHLRVATSSVRLERDVHYRLTVWSDHGTERAPRVVLTCVYPRPRNHPVGEQGQGRATHLQLLPHKQPRPYLPALLRMAHPRRAYEGEDPRPPSHPEAPAPPKAPLRVRFERGRRAGLRPISAGRGRVGLRPETGRFFVGARRSGVRGARGTQDRGGGEGSCWGRSWPSAAGTRSADGGAPARSTTRPGAGDASERERENHLPVLHAPVAA